MADNIDQQPQTSSETTKMSKTSAAAATTAANPTHNISFSIWPPSQRTRDAVTSRLIETLTSESVLSKRYGTVPPEEAADLAKTIEEEAFRNAGATGVKEGDDGIETLQVYSKEISKSMLEAVKSRSPPSGGAAPAPGSDVTVKEEESAPGGAAAAVVEEKSAEGDGAVEETAEGGAKAAEE